MKGSPADPDRVYASQSSGWFGQVDPALGRRRHDLGAGRQRVRLRRRPGHPPVVRRHAAPVGVRAGLAPRAVADRSRHGLCRGRGRGAVPLDRRRRRPGRSCPGLREHGSGPHWQPGAGGMCLHTILLDPTDPAPHLHRHLGGRRVPHRRRRQDLAADQPRPASPRASPTRTPRSATACTASRMHPSRPERRCSCRSTGT